MHYLIYQITNVRNGKVYIGCHQTTEVDDGYMGSGTILKRAVAKHGIESFTKTILHDFDSPEAMFAKEAELVTEEFVSRPDTYNLKVGGFGGWDYVNASGYGGNIHQTLEQISLSDPTYRSNLGKLATQAKRKLWTQNPIRRELSIQNSRRGLKLYFQSHPAIWAGRTHSSETKQKMSITAKSQGRGKGVKNPTYGKKWMTDGIRSQTVSSAEQPLFISNGWRYGRIIKQLAG